MSNYKKFDKVLVEAIVVGVLLLFLYIIVLTALSYNDIIKKNHTVHMLFSTFIAGGLFHIICEYTGINMWYVNDYNKIIQNKKI